MAPTRIMFIRHGEKPVPESAIKGVTIPTGDEDHHCLSVTGWIRAGAVAQYFGQIGGDASKRPTAVFASGVTPDSHSKREQQTVAPLVALLLQENSVHYKDGYDEADFEAVARDVMAQSGIVLVCWHHNKIHKLIAHLPNGPQTSPTWPEDRFDMVWVLDADGTGWKFSQMPMVLLSGDRPDPYT